MDIVIKKASCNDALLLATLGERTFYDAFASFNKEEDMQAYMQVHFTGQKLLSELGEEGADFYIAYIENIPVGFMKTGLGTPPEEIRAFRCMELERIYVLQQYQSKKVGDKLMQHYIANAKAREIQVLWLGVWEHNLRAVAFYQRFGFERFSEHIFQLGNDAQTDWLMMLKID